MPAFRSSYCDRCALLSDDGDAYGRTCTACRTTERLEAERIAKIDARAIRERLVSDQLTAFWQTTVGRTIPASVAVGLTLAAGEAHAAALVEPDTAPFYWMILCFVGIAVGLMGMILAGRWRFWSPVPDPHHQPFGDVPTLPQGRGE